LINFLIQFQKTFNPILLGLFLFSPYALCGQFQKTETTPPNLKWHYKKSENFKVLFPKNLDSIANYTINYLENNINNFLSTEIEWIPINNVKISTNDSLINAVLDRY